MTISGALNYFYNYTSPPPPPVKREIKNIIHTWYLSSGGESHLIRHDEQLEFLTIHGEKEISDFIDLKDIPEDFSSPEEFIEILIEMDHVFDAHGSLALTPTENLHTWKGKYRDPIELIYAVNRLYFKIALKKATVLRNFPALESLSIEEQVNEVKKKCPHVYGFKDKCFITFEEKVEEQKSAADGKTLIDMGHWCVTMLNSDTSNVLDDFCNPCNWLGHALLIVETIEEGDYFSRKIDLIKDMSSKEGGAKVRLFELSKDATETYAETYAKSETYRKPKEDIQRMMRQVWADICNQKKGKPNIFFKLDSNKMSHLMNFPHICNATEENLKKKAEITVAIKIDRDQKAWFAARMEVMETMRKKDKDNPDLLQRDQDYWEEYWEEYWKAPLGEYYQGTYNCAEYFARNFSLADIKEHPKTKNYVLSKRFFPSPVLYEGSRTKARIQELFLFSAFMTKNVGLPTLATFLIGGPTVAACALPALCFQGFNIYNKDLEQEIRIAQRGNELENIERERRNRKIEEPKN